MSEPAIYPANKAAYDRNFDHIFGKVLDERGNIVPSKWRLLKPQTIKQARKVVAKMATHAQREASKRINKSNKPKATKRKGAK